MTAFQDWSSNSILLCQPCIRRLNASYEFKKQCILSAQTWKAYLELLADSQKKAESQVSVNVPKQDAESSGDQKDADKTKPNSYIRVVPNQKLLKLYLPQAGQNQTSFQNVFLNIIPTNALKTPTQENFAPFVAPNPKDNSRNVFLNINNTFQRFVPLEPKGSKKEEVNVSKILTEAKTEELSVEIDPTDFGCMSEESPSQNVSDEKDWEEVISGTKIQATHDAVPSLVPINSNADCSFTKTQKTADITNEEKYAFFDGGHFLTPKNAIPSIAEFNMTCEMCDRAFDTMKNLRLHIKQFHLGKFPYKCDFCYSEFATRGAYNIHLEKHKCPSDTFLAKETLTLKDFPMEEGPPPITIPPPPISDVEMPAEKSENEEPEMHTCEVCGMSFQSANGLVRHKVRKHNQKSKKKYFVKGMKNARCTICNRDFSTQSYLQIHLKLHEKKGPNYRGKIFRNKYAQKEPTQNGNGFEESHNEKIKDATKDDRDFVQNGDSGEIRDPLALDVEDDIPKCLKLKINLRDMKCSDKGETEMETEESDGAINKALFLDISLECEQYLLEQQNGTGCAESNCITCKKAFEKKSDLKKYLNSLHSKSMQYKCHLCDSSFYEVSQLTKHLKMHCMSASCTICMKMFTDTEIMKIHNEVFHHNQANWQCSGCYIIDNDVDTLMEHVAQHENKFIYKCHFCDDEFKDARDLSDHINKHDGSHYCKECDKSFGYQHEKNIHDFTVHNRERHSCKICSKSYKTTRDLSRHETLHQYHPYLLHGEQLGESIKQK